MQTPDDKTERGERLNRYLSRCGVGSRRKADEFIQLGRVALNGAIVTNLATFVRVGEDTVVLDGRTLDPPPEERIWIVMNKSRGVLTTRRDTRGRVTIFDGLPPFFAKLIPVGRLDMDTDGVLLLTNDGDMANRLMHPRYEIERIYEALVDGVPSRASLRQMREGIDLGDSTPGRADASVIAKHPRGSVLRLLLKEGRNREVKRLCEVVGHRVQRLRRISFAGITARGIDRGGWRKLTPAEIQRLEKVPKSND